MAESRTGCWPIDRLTRRSRRRAGKAVRSAAVLGRRDVILKGVCPAEYPQNEKPLFLAGAEVVAIFKPPPLNLKMVKKKKPALT